MTGCIGSARPRPVASSLAGGLLRRKDNGQNSLDPQGPASREDRQPLHPDLLDLGRRRGRSSSATSSSSRCVPVPARARTRTRSRSTATPARDRLDDRPGAHPRRHRRPTVGTIFDLDEEPPATSLQVTVVGKQWWWEFHYPTRGGRHRQRAGHPDGPPVARRPRRLRRSPPGLQRDPLLLGPGAQREEGRRPGRDQHITIEADEPGHLPRPVRRVLRPVARQHAVPGDRADRTTSTEWVQRSRTARRPFRVGPARPERPRGPAQAADRHEVPVHELPHRSTTRHRRPIGPNLTHLASRTDVRERVYEPNRART